MRKINSDTKRMSRFTWTLLYIDTLQFASNSQTESQTGYGKKKKKN